MSYASPSNFFYSLNTPDLINSILYDFEDYCNRNINIENQEVVRSKYQKEAIEGEFIER